MSHDNYSLSARVYNHIRDGILAGTFAKGDELKEKNIGDELGVSRTPVREALRQLELEGLVSIIPNKGAFVEGVSTDDIRKGQYVYAQCLSDASKRRLLGSDVPSFFGSGSLQALANEPTQQPSIGWHPRYIDLLKGDDEHSE